MVKTLGGRLAIETIGVARVFIVALPLVLVAVASGHADHQRAARLGPVRLTYPQLLSIVAAARRSAGSANATFVHRAGPVERLSAEADDASLSVESWFDRPDLFGAPEGATSVRYSYDLPGAPISAIRIDLNDFSREVSVSGQSPDQVIDTLNILRERLGAYEVVFGGFPHRMLGGFLLFALAAVGWTAGFGFDRHGRRTGAIVFFVGATMLQLSVWVAPWEAWFPGAVVYSGDSPWFIRYAAEIGLLSLAVTLAGFGLTVIQLWKPGWLSRTKSPAPAAPAAPALQPNDDGAPPVPAPTDLPASPSPEPHEDRDR